MLTIVSIVGALLLSWLFHVTYVAFGSTLSKIPSAHPTCGLSTAWLRIQGALNRRNKAINEAHRRLGPVVRLTPDYISVNCITSGVQTIYRDFEKPDSSAFAYYGKPNMFTISGNAAHASRRRKYGNIWTKSTLQTSSEFLNISETVCKTLTGVLKVSSQETREIDFFDLAYALSLDYIIPYIFGQAQSLDWLGEIRKDTSWKRPYFRTTSSDPWPFDPPNILERLLGAFGKPLNAPDILTKNDEVAKTILRLNEHSYQRLLENDSRQLVYDQLYRGFSSCDLNLSVDDRMTIASETTDQVAAGTDATAIALIYLLHFISLQPAAQQQLRHELFTLEGSLRQRIVDSDFTTELIREIDNLPILDAIMTETLRVRTPDAGYALRVVPAGGATIAGYAIPGGVHVAAQPYCLHRNEDAFPDPEEFHYERWLMKDEAKQALQKKSYWAFGSGSRMCTGNHFFLLEAKLILATIYSCFVSKIIDDHDIDPVDAFIGRPRGDKLILRFEQADSSD